MESLKKYKDSSENHYLKPSREIESTHTMKVTVSAMISPIDLTTDHMTTTPQDQSVEDAESSSKTTGFKESMKKPKDTTPEKKSSCNHLFWTLRKTPDWPAAFL